MKCPPAPAVDKNGADLELKLRPFGNPSWWTGEDDCSISLKDLGFDQEKIKAYLFDDGDPTPEEVAERIAHQESKPISPGSVFVLVEPDGHIEAIISFPAGGTCRCRGFGIGFTCDESLSLIAPNGHHVEILNEPCELSLEDEDVEMFELTHEMLVEIQKKTAATNILVHM